MKTCAIAWALLMPALAAASTTSSRPPIQVTPPQRTPAAPDEDDVPGPPPELGPANPAGVELPAIPELARLPARRPQLVARPAFKPVGMRARNLSIAALNACHAALVDRRFEAAVTSCRASITAWAGNHRAWYGWASASTARGKWDAARTAVEQAVALRPDLAMYQMVHGVTLYQAAWQRARDAQGAAGDARVKLEAARAALGRAIAIDPRLWRAHYYLGCIERDRHADGSAAEHFTTAIRLNPGHRAGYVALSELYRATGHHDEALAVATAGTARVPAADAASVWFEVAMAHDAVSAGRDAIAAMTRAIALRPADALLKLERSRLLFQSANLAAARRDLEDVARTTDPQSAAAKERATQLLDELATDGSLPDAIYRTCGALRVCYPTTISHLIWMGAAWQSPIQ